MDFVVASLGLLLLAFLVLYLLLSLSVRLDLYLIKKRLAHVDNQVKRGDGDEKERHLIND